MEKIVQDEGLRKEKGSKGAMVFRSSNEPDEVFLIFTWDDDKPFIDYFNLPEVQKALADKGSTEIIEVSESSGLSS